MSFIMLCVSFFNVPAFFLYDRWPSLARMMNLDGLMTFPSKVQVTVMPVRSDVLRRHWRRSLWPSSTVRSPSFSTNWGTDPDPLSLLFFSLISSFMQLLTAVVSLSPFFSGLPGFFLLVRTERKSVSVFVSASEGLLPGLSPFFPNTARKSICWVEFPLRTSSVLALTPFKLALKSMWWDGCAWWRRGRPRSARACRLLLVFNTRCPKTEDGSSSLCHSCHSSSPRCSLVSNLEQYVEEWQQLSPSLFLRSCRCRYRSCWSFCPWLASCHCWLSHTLLCSSAPHLLLLLLPKG